MRNRLREWPPSAGLQGPFLLALEQSPLFFPLMSARFLRYWLPVLLWMCLVFSASTSLGTPQHTSRFIRPLLLWLNPHMSEQTIESVHHFIRKCAHFTEYGVLGLLIFRLVQFDTALAAQSTGSQIRLALLLSALYASTDEFHQLFVTGRQAAVQDVLLDTCGATFGLLLFWLARRERRRLA